MRRGERIAHLMQPFAEFRLTWPFRCAFRLNVVREHTQTVVAQEARDARA